MLSYKNKKASIGNNPSIDAISKVGRFSATASYEIILGCQNISMSITPARIALDLLNLPTPMKYLGGLLGKQGDAVKQFFESNKKLKKNMKSPKNRNIVLFNVDKNTSTHKELGKINNINHMKYDSSGDSNKYISDDYSRYSDK